MCVVFLSKIILYQSNNNALKALLFNQFYSLQFLQLFFLLYLSYKYRYHFCSCAKMIMLTMIFVSVTWSLEILLKESSKKNNIKKLFFANIFFTFTNSVKSFIQTWQKRDGALYFHFCLNNFLNIVRKWNERYGVCFEIFLHHHSIIFII